MATVGTGAGNADFQNPGTQEVTPPASATMMVGCLLVGYEFTTLSVTAPSWDGNDMTDGPNVDETSSDVYARVDYYASPGTSAADISGGGGDGAQMCAVGGIGIAGSETSDPVRDSNSGTTTGNPSWSPTGDTAGDVMVMGAIVYNETLSAGTGSTSFHVDDQAGNFTSSTIMVYVVSVGSSDTIDVTSTGATAAWAAISIKTASSGYTIDAEAGSYAWTGADANTEYGYAVDAESTSYVWSAPVETLLTYSQSNDYEIVAEATTYVWTGSDAELVYQEELDAESGSYAWTGTDVDWTVVRYGDPGAYAITGTDANLVYGNILDAEAASYVWTGADATLTAATTVSAESGSYEIVPGWSTLDDTYSVSEESLNLDATTTAIAGTWNSGSSPARVRGISMYMVNGPDPGASPTGEFRYAVYDVSGTPGVDAVPTGSALMTTEPFDVTSIGDRFHVRWLELRPTSAWTPVANTDYMVVVEDVSLSLGGSAVRWGLRTTDISGRNVATYDGTWSELQAGLIGPLFGVVTAPSAALNFGAEVDGDTTSYTWTGADAELTYGSPDDYIIVGESTSYTWTGSDANLEYHRYVSMEGTSYTWTGTDADFRVGDSAINIEAGSFAWTGTDADLVLAGGDGWTRQTTTEEVWTVQ